MPTNDDEAPFEQTIRRVAAGAPVTVPEGAISSPFAMARVYAGNRFDVDAPVPPPPTSSPAASPAPAPATNREGETMDKRSGPRGPNLRTRACETLRAFGPLTVEQLAEGLGCDLAKARKLATNGVQSGHWKRRNIEGESHLVLAGAKVTKNSGPSGAKRHVKKHADKAPKPRSAVRRAAIAAPATAPISRRPKGFPATLPPAPAPIALRAAPASQAAQYGLFNTGELHIEYGGQELKLPREATRALVDYLEKLAAAIKV